MVRHGVIGTVLAVIFVVLLLAACAPAGADPSGGAAAPLLQGPPAPDEVVRQFLTAWQNGDYQGMYRLLSRPSQSEYTFPVFETSYRNAVSAINPTELRFSLTETRVQGASAAVGHSVTFVAPVFGEIADEGRIMRLVRGENGAWGIAWSPMDIVNGLTGGGRVVVEARRLPRANIYDRDGRVLVEQGGTMVALYASQLEMAGPQECLDLLARVLRVRRFDLEQYFGRFNTDTVFFLGEIDSETDAVEGAQLDAVCGVGPTGRFSRQTRRYVGFGAAAHVTGYISFIPQDQVAAYVEQGYDPGDLVGLVGIERAYERELAGQPEQVLRLLSPGNLPLRELGGRSGVPPQPVQLTLDRDLQMAAAQAVADAFNYAAGNWGNPVHSPGAGAVMLDVNTGAVLAMVSFPSFGPSIFNPDTPALTQNPTLIADLQGDPRQPFTNRVTQQQYFPGSVWKIITTAAAANEQMIPLDELFSCELSWDGSQTFGDTASPRSDWRVLELPDSPFAQPAGPITLAQALSTSCNPMFYEMGARLFSRRGPNVLLDYARQMGMGAATGIGVLPEAGGLLPEAGSVEAGINEAIGQGGVQVTILQMARMVAAVANGGTLYQPYLVEQVGGLDGAPVSVSSTPRAVGQLGLGEAALATVREGMCGAVTNFELGTAARVFEGAPYTACGKTGTAQSGRIEPYGWFVAFAPAENPQVALAAMVEFSREGSETAAPIIRRILDSYFQAEPAPFPLWWFENTYVPLEIPEGLTGG